MLNGEILREDEPMKVLKQCYNGTKYEWLFLGEFTDRVHTFDSASMPSVFLSSLVVLKFLTASQSSFVVGVVLGCFLL